MNGGAGERPDPAADPLADGWRTAAPIAEARDRHRRCTLGECVHYDVVPCEVSLVLAALAAVTAERDQQRARADRWRDSWGRVKQGLREGYERKLAEETADLRAEAVRLRARIEAAEQATHRVVDDGPLHYFDCNRVRYESRRCDCKALDDLAAVLAALREEGQ